MSKRIGKYKVSNKESALTLKDGGSSEGLITGIIASKKVDSSTLNTGGDVTTTLTAAQSGTTFVVDGTGDLVVNLPALSTSNVGLCYRFVVTTAVGGGKTATFVLPGSGVSNFHGLLHLTGNASTCATTHDVAGDTLTFVNSTIVGTTLDLCCLTDDGTNSRWEAVFFGSPVATID